MVAGIACVVALGVWLYRIIYQPEQIDHSHLAALLSVVFGYAICVGGGWLWGKYQNAAKQEEQIADLQTQVKQLTSTNQSLMLWESWCMNG